MIINEFTIHSAASYIKDIALDAIDNYAEDIVSCLDDGEVEEDQIDEYRLELIEEIYQKLVEIL